MSILRDQSQSQIMESTKNIDDTKLSRKHQESSLTFNEVPIINQGSRMQGSRMQESYDDESDTTCLPNGSIITASRFVKNILEALTVRPEQCQIKQFLRLAEANKHQDIKVPFTILVLPNETPVENIGQILNSSSNCLILLKEGQKFQRKVSRLQEICLDSLK